MSHLYELAEQHRELQKLVDEGEVTQEMLGDTFEALEGEFNDKAVAGVKVIQNLDRDIESVDAEIKRLQERKKTLVNRKESLRDYLRVNMEVTGTQKIECPLFVITLGKPKPMVIIEDEDDIPVEYKNIKSTITIDKKRLLEALKNLEGNEAIAGAKLGESKSTLLIK